VSKISRKYYRTVPWYYVAVVHCVGRNLSNMDWSGEALMACYEWESRGLNKHLEQAIFALPPYNGYAVGKFWLDVMINECAEQLVDGYLLKCEIANDFFTAHFEKQILARMPYIIKTRAQPRERAKPGIMGDWAEWFEALGEELAL